MDSLKDADGNYPVVTVERGERVVRGELVYLSFDSAAVRQTEPLRGGCVRMKIHPPFDKGLLVNKDGHINEYGAEFIGDILVALDDAALTMQQHLPAFAKPTTPPTSLPSPSPSTTPSAPPSPSTSPTSPAPSKSGLEATSSTWASIAEQPSFVGRTNMLDSEWLGGIV